MPKPTQKTNWLGMSPAFQEILARLTRDSAFRDEYLSDPAKVAAIAGLSAAESETLAEIRKMGFQFKTSSVEAKESSSWLKRLLRL